MKAPIHRRTFLRGAGGIAVALPPLSAMLLPLRSVAQSEAIPKRCAFFFSPNGTIFDRWVPEGTGTDFTLSEILAPLEAHKSQLNILKGVSMVTAQENSGGRNGHDTGAGHCLVARPLTEGPSGFGEFGHLWDGSAGGISIDQHMANQIGGETPYPSLEFGLGARRLGQAIPSRISWRAEFEPSEPMEGPGGAFERLFGDFQASGEERTRAQTKRTLIVDSVLEDYRRVRLEVGAEDRVKLDAHLSALEELERRISSTAMNQCQAPAAPEEGDTRANSAAQIEIMATALACNLTRVITLQNETGQGGGRFPWLNTERYHHDLSHDGDSEQETQDILAGINHYYASQFALLLDHLASVTELDGQSLLDHSAILWVNELGKGNSHTYDNMPYVLAGGAGGAFETGRVLEYDGAPHGNLFVSLLQAMGIQEDTFGDPEYCTGPLAGL